MFQDPTSIAQQGGAGITGWRTNATAAPVSNAASLLVAGPTQGDVNVAAEPFLVSANGALAVSVVVTPSASGGTVSWSPTSATLANGSSVSFVPTPSTVGPLVFTFAATGLTSAIALYESESPTQTLDLDTTWMIDVDPANPFEASHGSIPAGVVAHAATPDPDYSPALANKVGVTNKPRAVITLGDNSGDLPFNLDKQYNAQSTATQILAITQNVGGLWDSSYAMFSRVADPDDAGQWCFRNQGDKTKIGFNANTTVKWRSFAQTTSDAQRSDPWGVENWVACGFRFDSDWVHGDRGPYNLILSLHDGNDGLMGGSSFDMEILPGDGNAADVQLRFTVKRYKLETWPQNQSLKNKRNHEFTSNIAGGLQVNTRYWFVLHYKTGNGFPDYPNYDPDVGGNPGAPVWGTYGSTDPEDPFIELFMAQGTASPEKIFRWDNAFAVANGIPNGFWGGPHPTTSSAEVKQYQCYVQVGLYTNSKFQPSAQIGNELGLYTKGYTQWRAKDVPGINEQAVLDWFRTNRT